MTADEKFGVRLGISLGVLLGGWSALILVPLLGAMWTTAYVSAVGVGALVWSARQYQREEDASTHSRPKEEA